LVTNNQNKVTEGAPFGFLIDLKILSGTLEPTGADLTFSTKLSIVVSAMDSLENGHLFRGDRLFGCTIGCIGPKREERDDTS
jgi:hypothetical protein